MTKKNEVCVPKLYVGLDESNHGRDDEVVVAIFSRIGEDSVPLRIEGHKKINEKQLLKHLRNPRRDYRATYLDRKELGSRNPLVYSAPRLIGAYSGFRREEYDVEVLFDGEVRESDITSLRKILKTVPGIYSVRVRQFPKRSNSKYRYPLLLLMADKLAHHIFRRESFARKAFLERRML